MVSKAPRGPTNAGPSPQKTRIYSGPAVPVAYDPNWQYFTNLTADQVGFFQAQPEWQNFLAYVALSPNTAQTATPVAAVNAALQAAVKPVVVAKNPVIVL